MKNKRTVDFSCGIVEGEHVRHFVDHLELLAMDDFKQRKNYDEYYYTGHDKERDIPVNLLFVISEDYEIKINYQTITIEV